MSPNCVGVVIRTRDRPVFVVRALASVLAQTHPDWHVRIINDGGDAAALDATLAPVLASVPAHAQPGGTGHAHRVVVHHLPASVGRSAAFNTGVRALDTPFVTCLDDDDTWSPGFMSELLAFHQALAPGVADLGGVAAHVIAMREDIRDTPDGPVIEPLGDEGLPPAFTRRDLFLNPITYGAYRQDVYPVQWMLRRDLVLRTGGFPEDFDVMEDRAFLLRFLQHWRVAVLDRPLARHHRRVGRTSDSLRTIWMNTLDNPSYDWREHADRAKMPVASRPDCGLAALPGLIRASATTVLRELNDETSSIWLKTDGEARGLHERLDRLEDAVLHRGAGRQMRVDPAAVVFDLWDHLEWRDHGFGLEPQRPFATRLVLSRQSGGAGLLAHVSSTHRRMSVQIPDTGEWTALELALDGLAMPDTGLRCSFELLPAADFLFETALSLRRPATDGTDTPSVHQLGDFRIHAAFAHTPCLISREVGPADLLAGRDPRLSLILPRQARNFHLSVINLIVEHDRPDEGSDAEP